MKSLFKNLGWTACVSLLFAPMGLFVGVFALIMALSIAFASNAGSLFSTLPLTQFDVLHAAVLKRSDERQNVKHFLSSFFRLEERDSLNVVFNTKSKNKNVAIDVNYQTDGILHKRKVETGQMLQIHQYVKYTNLTISDLYTGIALNPDASAREIYNFSEIISRDLHEIADEIDRARELQCAQLLKNGILQFTSNDNINFGRSASSIVTATTPWTANTGDPLADIEAGIKWIRQNSNNTSTIFNVIMGEAAAGIFITNDKVQAVLNNRRIEIGRIAPEMENVAGGNFIGEFTTTGGHLIRVWSYTETYVNAAGVEVSYVDKNDAIIIPNRNELTMVKGAVRLLPGTMNSGMFRGKATWETMDYRAQVHKYHVAERFVAIPQELNEIYTLKATNVS